MDGQCRGLHFAARVVHGFGYAQSLCTSGLGPNIVGEAQESGKVCLSIGICRSGSGVACMCSSETRCCTEREIIRGSRGPAQRIRLRLYQGH